MLKLRSGTDLTYCQIGQDTVGGGGEVVDGFWHVGHSPVSEKEGNVRYRRKWKGEAENRRWLVKQGRGKRAKLF